MDTKVKILYFASIKELTNLKEDYLIINKVEHITGRDLKQAIVTKHPNTSELLESCMFAIDGEYVFDHTLSLT